jgi:PPM family protein phosphatase
MGTTVLAVLFYDNRITIAHVGDSRLYRLRNKYFEQLTHDHSLTQVLINQDLFTPEEAQGNVSKNLITRALGVDETVEIEVPE